MTEKFRIEPGHLLLIGALLLAFFASYLLMAPYVSALMLAFLLSLLCYPLHQRVVKRFPSYPNLSAFISCVLLIIIIVIPLSLVFTAIVYQGITFTRSSYIWVSEGGAQQLLQHPYVQHILVTLNQWLPFESINNQAIVDRGSQLASSVGKVMLDLSTTILGNITGLLFHFVLMIFVLFFLLRDHDKFVDQLYEVIPLSRSQKEALLFEVKKVARSAVLGSFLTAIAQGIVGGIALTIVGLPGLFWGTMMGFAAFIPVVGTALIWLPASLYLFLVGDWHLALFLVLWGALVVGSIDNFLRPVLMQGSSNMSTLMIFLSLIGGLQLFGLSGLLYGPIIFGLTVVLFKLYTIEFKSFLEKQDKS